MTTWIHHLEPLMSLQVAILGTQWGSEVFNLSSTFGVEFVDNRAYDDVNYSPSKQGVCNYGLSRATLSKKPVWLVDNSPDRNVHGRVCVGGSREPA